MIEQMKPSGIDWIGDVPQSWIVSKVKYNTIIPLTDGPHETPVFVDEGIPFYSVDGIQDDKIVYEPCRYISTEDANRFDIKVKPQRGDILMGKAASVGKIAIIDKDVRLQVWSPLAVIRVDEKRMNNRFLRYYLLSSAAQVEIDLKSTSNTQKNIAMEDIENITILKPEVKEQLVIADYLDSQCSKLDSIIADLEKQIDTLQKYKKSLITETVTKGLDKSAPVKDSGIEWIGKIPEHWEVKKFSYECERIGDIDHYMPDSVDEGIPYVMTGDFIGEGNDIDFENCKQISRQDYLRLSRKMKPMINDILFARYATIGTVRIVDTDKEFLVSYSCAIIRVKKTLFSKYVFYYLKSGAFYEEISKYINTNTQGNVGIDSIGRAKIPLPPVSEQELIADFLDEKCTQIDELLQIKQSQLSSIKRHKKFLIYEYVTGKKRVTEVK